MSRLYGKGQRTFQERFGTQKLADRIEDIAVKVKEYTPNNKWTNDNGSDIHFIITGGEPMLWQRETQQLLRQPEFNDLKKGYDDAWYFSLINIHLLIFEAIVYTCFSITKRFSISCKAILFMIDFYSSKDA